MQDPNNNNTQAENTLGSHTRHDDQKVPLPQQHHHDISEVTSNEVLSVERKFDAETCSPSELHFTQEKKALLFLQ